MKIDFVFNKVIWVITCVLLLLLTQCTSHSKTKDDVIDEQYNNSIDDIPMPSNKNKRAAVSNNSKSQQRTKNISSKQSVKIAETDSLKIYYPSYKSIDLCVATMPDKERDKNVIFCCEAAYTNRCLDYFEHINIAGDHVSSGVREHGCRCTRNTGAFVWYDGRYKFLYNNYSCELDSASCYGGMGFGQEMLIHKGEIKETIRPNNNCHVFRALCDVNNELCIIQSKQAVELGKFKKLLLKYGAIEAIYLDMGRGWNHAWYRDENGVAIEIFPKAHNYCTNWLTFCK